MTQNEKASIYDECLRQSDILERKNSKLKSQYINDIPSEVQKEIDINNKQIEFLVKKVESLFRQ